MSKKVLVISSSPRRGGNSDSLCDEFLRGALSAGHQAEKVFLADQKINYCTGCGGCYTVGKCVQKDDAGEIISKMIAADVIVLATPVYFYCMSAQLKTLIDRCAGEYTKISGKDFYYILTAADDVQANMQSTIDSLRGYTIGCLEKAREKGILLGLGLTEKGDVQGSQYLQQAYLMGAHC